MFFCDGIPVAVKCASVSRWACRKRRRKNSPRMRVDQSAQKQICRVCGWTKALRDAEVEDQAPAANLVSQVVRIHTSPRRWPALAVNLHVAAPLARACRDSMLGADRVFGLWNQTFHDCVGIRKALRRCQPGARRAVDGRDGGHRRNSLCYFYNAGSAGLVDGTGYPTRSWGVGFCGNILLEGLEGAAQCCMV
jgi:hypothetical protein